MSTKNVLQDVLVLSRTNYVTFLDVENSNEEHWKLFGLWYKTEREKAGKTQEEVAESAELHPKTISRIENGEPTKRSTVIALAKAVGADTDQAVKRAFAPENNTETQIIAERLAGGVMASGFNDLEDEDLREAFFEDMQSIAEASIRRRLQEQQKRRKENKQL